MIDDPTQWQQFVDGDEYDPTLACQAAETFAARNNAEVEGCSPAGLGFRVTVHSTGTVGQSIVPGTESRQAVAAAAAVIEPRCSFTAPEPSEEPEPPPTAPAETEEEPEPIRGLVCDGSGLEIDPEAPVLPDVDDLFRVRLTGDDE
ncbi:hypothetical protein ABT117_09550 [Streptomyces sp. NPDC002262]|uniref:hypothetical protein n=1 Tax=unclassified Streptomyces TaxID=2593676 RepID=UPI0033208CA5